MCWTSISWHITTLLPRIAVIKIARLLVDLIFLFHVRSVFTLSPISHSSKQLGNIDWQYFLAILILQRNKLNGGQPYILLSTFSVFFLIFSRTLIKLLFPKFELSLDNFCNDQLEVCQFYRAMIAQLFSTFTINCNPSKLTFFNLPLKKVSLFL